MSTPEELREDAKREAYEEKYDLIAPDPCPQCGQRKWRQVGYDSAYGADADGRRGTMLREWECIICGHMETTVGR